jgi:MoaA/NifB/PqqE/SkfB family radical SAM enzyme
MEHDTGLLEQAQSPAELEAHPFYGFLEQLVDILSDDLDHPDVWGTLASVSAAELTELHALVRGFRPLQADKAVIRIFDTLDGLIETINGDAAAGLALLRQAEAVSDLSPQVAGALFFASRLHNPDRSADLSTRFCEAPFVKFETLIDGTVAPCCSIWTKQRLGHLDRQSFAEIWNSADAQAMRESILDGSYRYCNKSRCTLITEDALPERDAVADPELRRVIDGDITEMTASPRWLFLAHDVTCNLACPSCRSELIGAVEEQQARFQTIEESVFRPLFQSEGEVTLSISGQGDPWSSPHYRSILRYMADHELNTKLNIHTNALLMTEARWNQYAGLAKYRPLVDVSIDACSPHVYEYVRRPGKWERLLPNLQFIGRGRAAGLFSAYFINATIQLDNFHEMGALVDFGAGLGADNVRLYMIQNTGGHLAPDFKRKNVADAAHPLHLMFLEALRDPRLAFPVAHLYDVAGWRTHSLAETLPSDRLRQGYAREELLTAIDEAIGAGRFEEVAALAMAGRLRFGADPLLLEIEARALERLGFARQAGYRRAEAAAQG